MSVPRHWAGLRANRSPEGGYVAMMTALLLLVLMGLAAFAVDVGRWYVVGQQEQRAADAAALAGVPSLPGDPTLLPNGAYATAKNFSKINGFENSVNRTTVTPLLEGGNPTRLRVTVSRTVDNIFGPLLGIPTTTVTRTAVADFGGPVPMGSPCNEFGDDPETGTNRGSTCAGVSGKLWASISAPGALKQNGDAYQANDCSSGSPAELCPNSGTNSEYDANGYFYTVSVKKSMPSLTIELFDPAWVDVEPDCDTSSFGTGTTEARDALNIHVTDEATRYVTGDTAWCTGDRIYSGSTVMNTSFAVRSPSATPWNPLSFLEIGGNCSKVYDGFLPSGTQGLFKALNLGSVGYRDDIAQSFRRWTTLCTIPSPAIGDYLVQVKTNGIGSDAANTANRFAIRAYSSGDASAKDSISIAGRERMAIYVNAKGATAEFYLARVPSAAAGQSLRVRLFDVGDSTDPGDIQITKPPDALGSAFSGCKGTGAITMNMSTCAFTVNTSTYNGKWETVFIPIPPDYSCIDLDATKCWVRLKYPYGGSANPHDQTTWTAGIDGDPVRLVE